MPKSTCTLPECDKPLLARGYCKRHYRMFMKYGNPRVCQKLHGSLDQRFWPRVEKGEPGECWPWTGDTNKAGYGRLTFYRATLLAHRVSYELNVGPIPDGLHIDHVLERGCTRKDCVNPTHLEAVTPRTNTLRSPSGTGATNHRKTHCLNGHEFTTDNTYVGPKGGRRCRTCRANQKASPNRRVAA